MPQRPEDYQSTLNRGANKLGGTGAGHNDPFAYLKITPEHAHLGHFRQGRFLKEGHNVAPAPRRRAVSDVTAGRATIQRPGRSAAVSRSVENISRRTAKAAIRAGGAAGAAVAAERPVLAARVAARQAGVGRQERRSMVRAARESTESRRSERRARRNPGQSFAQYGGSK